ncbi:MAG: hypothetical protein BWX54_01824 [Verrucomicrobia bacterium ADurb.Bin018]|nr:MAG: hypothetical protein BWX54_01824 [Verrucomicrobia bacterium ADurb.Bin018]
MKLSDKPLELKKTVGEVIEALRANGLEKDAEQVQTQVAQIASFTSWSRGEVLSLDFGEWPALARRFAALMTGKSETAIPPPIAIVSESTPQAQDDPSRSGQTS